MTIDLGKRRILIDGQLCDLTAREFDFVAFLAQFPGRPFTREQLLEAVWGYTTGEHETLVNTVVNRIRQKLERDPMEPRYLKTARGVGYRFADIEELDGESGPR